MIGYGQFSLKNTSLLLVLIVFLYAFSFNILDYTHVDFLKKSGKYNQLHR